MVKLELTNEEMSLLLLMITDFIVKLGTKEESGDILYNDDEYDFILLLGKIHEFLETSGWSEEERSLGGKLI